MINIKSDSMSPLVRVNSKLKLYKINNHDKLERFDIIVFYQASRFVCHFLWRRGKCMKTGDSLWVTRSLKSKYEDDVPIRAEQILGQVKDIKLTRAQKLKCLLGNFLKRSS